MLIPGRVLNIARIASKDVERYGLQGVYLFRGGEDKPRATACNGKLLLETTWREDPADEFPTAHGVDPAPKPGFAVILPREELLEAGKGIDPKTARVKPILANVALDESHKNGKVKLLTTDLSACRLTEPQTIDKTYPNYERAFPKTKGHKVTLDAVLLRDLLDVLLKIHKTEEGRREVELTVYAADRPVEIKAADRDGVESRALIMPVCYEKR